MSDRSYAAVTFYRCSPEQWSEVVPLIQDAVDLDWGTFPGDAPDEQSARLQLGEQYNSEQTALGDLFEALVEVHRQFPDVVFFGQQEAKYEYPGDVVIASDLGLFKAEIDQSGDVVFTYEQIKALTAPRDTAAGLLDELARLAGVAQYAEIQRWAALLTATTSKEI